MKLFICPNRTREKQLEAAARCIALLEERCDAQCRLSAENSSTLFGSLSHEGTPEDCDLVVSVGGDGAVLRAAQTAIRYRKPIVGINAGRLGYLCALNAADLETADERIFGDLRVSERLLLEFSLEGRIYTALNDVIAAKKDFGATVALRAHQGDTQIAEWRGDGIVAATPTGSTSYSFSAGGPVVDPSLSAVILTPICPHFGDARSVILNADDPISLSVKDPQYNTACIYSDGVKIGDLHDTVTIRRSPFRLPLLTAKNQITPNKEEEQATK